jgi:hypothetical protein
MEEPIECLKVHKVQIVCSLGRKYRKVSSEAVNDSGKE